MQIKITINSTIFWRNLSYFSSIVYKNSSFSFSDCFTKFKIFFPYNYLMKFTINCCTLYSFLQSFHNFLEWLFDYFSRDRLIKFGIFFWDHFSKFTIFFSDWLAKFTIWFRNLFIKFDVCFFHLFREICNIFSQLSTKILLFSAIISLNSQIFFPKSLN